MLIQLLFFRLKSLILIIKMAFVLILFLVQPVQSAPVKGLNAALVPVAGRDKENFHSGLREALVLVLMKNSASSKAAIMGNPNLAGDLQNGHRYAEQFSYQTRESKNAAGEVQEQLYLKASFPATVISEFLQRGGMSFWPASRPSTLVLPVLKINGTLSLNSKALDEQLQLNAQISDAAFRYGIPLVKDEPSSFADSKLRSYWQWHVAALERSAANIDKDAIFTGRIAITSDGSVMGGWMLLQGDRKDSVDVHAKSLAAFVDKGFAWLAKRWSRQYAVQLQLAGNEQMLTIRGIENQQQYTQLMSYLNALDVVDQVYVLQLDPGQLSLAVALKAQVEQFEKVLALSRQLSVDDTGAATLSYRWVAP